MPFQGAEPKNLVAGSHPLRPSPPLTRDNRSNAILRYLIHRMKVCLEVRYCLLYADLLSNVEYRLILLVLFVPKETNLLRQRTVIILPYTV